MGNALLSNRGSGDANIKFEKYMPPNMARTNNYLETGISRLSATTVGNYALFGGGYTAEPGSANFSTVFSYNNNLSRGTVPELSEARYYLSSTAVENYALFAGGLYRKYKLFISSRCIQ